MNIPNAFPYEGKVARRSRDGQGNIHPDYHRIFY